MASKVRSLRRGIVHKQMADEGHRWVNKPYIVDAKTGQKIKHNSYFSENWRKFKMKGRYVNTEIRRGKSKAS